MDFNERIQEARRRAGLTQTELAQRLGVTQSAIHKLESGKSRTSRRTVKIAQVCGVDPVWLDTGRETNALADPSPLDEVPRAPTGRRSATRPPEALAKGEELFLLHEDARRLRQKLQLLEKQVGRAMQRMLKVELAPAPDGEEGEKSGQS